MSHTDIVIVRSEENQRRFDEIQTELARSLAAQKVMAHLIRKGKFKMIVKARQTESAKKLGLRNLPTEAYIEYESGTRVWLDYNQWAVLSRQYYSPDVHRCIARHWNSRGT